MSITTLQKRLILILTILVVCMVAITFSLFRGIYVNPDTILVRYKILKDERIPESLNDISIVYFTDLQYGEFENDDRVKQCIQTIQNVSPDIVLFGGDLYDSGTEITDETNQKLADWFSSIDAPLGKFAIWGEKDIQDDTHIQSLQWIYKTSQFEILDNWNIRIGNQTSSSVRLIGISPTVNWDQALANISNNEYNILLSHYPDLLVDERLASTPISLALAGHAHGTQISLPILGGYRQIEGATELNTSKYRDLSFPYYLSTGIGCTNINIRLNATPEIYHFTLKHS